jgi:3-oxoadipate enol-lactonase
MDMAVDDLGTGPPVLFVHGLGGTGNVWGALVAALARHFRTVCPDLPGCGRTPRHDGVGPTELGAQLRALLDRLSIERAHIVGHSYGSVIAQHLALDAPERILSLSLIGPIQAPTEAARTLLRERAAKARESGMAAIADATVQVGTAAHTRTHRPEVAAFVRELVMGQNPAGYASMCEAVAGCTAAAIERLRCPTLVVTGDEDATAPPRVAAALAQKIPAAAFQVIARCGHWTPLEQPLALTGLLSNFLFDSERALAGANPR